MTSDIIHQRPPFTQSSSPVLVGDLKYRKDVRGGLHTRLRSTSSESLVAGLLGKSRMITLCSFPSIVPSSHLWDSLAVPVYPSNHLLILKESLLEWKSAVTRTLHINIYHSRSSSRLLVERPSESTTSLSTLSIPLKCWLAVPKPLRCTNDS